MIRESRIDDVEALVLLAQQLNDWVWSHTGASRAHDTSKYRRNILSSQSDSRWKCFVLEIKGEVLGYCTAGLDGSGGGTIGSLVVSPELRGYGSGIRLALTAVERLRERGVRTITCNISEHNPVRHLALKAGFVKSGREYLLKLTDGPRRSSGRADARHSA
jgi:ribosomal protein S18 acetylase RimI-like enzyme